MITLPIWKCILPVMRKIRENTGKISGGQMSFTKLPWLCPHLLSTFAYCERNPLDVTQDTDFQTVASTTCYGDTTEWSAFGCCTNFFLKRLVHGSNPPSCHSLDLYHLFIAGFRALCIDFSIAGSVTTLRIFCIAEKESLLWM